VQEAFDTRGFGSWKPNAPETVELKGSDAPLIDSAQMRHAVDSRAVALNERAESRHGRGASGA
jgi:hypothetical protein